MENNNYSESNQLMRVSKLDQGTVSAGQFKMNTIITP